MCGGKIDVLGVNVHAVNIEQVLGMADDKIHAGNKGYITVTGVHGIMECQRSEQVKSAHRNAWLVVPDGMPLVYIGRSHGHKNMRRCFGPDLMSALLAHSVEREYTHFFYGGNDGVAEKLEEKLEQRYPGLQVVGTYTPPFRPLNEQEKSELIEAVDNLKPHFFWVGLSTPKQELFMQEYLPLLDTRIMVGVGAAFDYHTDRLTPAPKWMQGMALEWFYRMLMEPRRLWKRYFINNPLFLLNLFFQITNLRKYK
jgi:N-acetylglucosaminyldiphosphoundecaprenol N-acetyl-beta-D-mannosaminyltransferase